MAEGVQIDNNKLQTMQLVWLAALVLLRRQRLDGHPVTPADTSAGQQIEAKLSIDSGGYSWEQVHEYLQAVIKGILKNQPKFDQVDGSVFIKGTCRNSLGFIAKHRPELLTTLSSNGVPFRSTKGNRLPVYYVPTDLGEKIALEWAKEIGRTLAKQDVISNVAERLVSST
ncbi:MAG: hypothetical protein U0638_12565 [Phycisphaerales bacterium]